MAHPQTNFSSNFQGVDPPLEGYWHDDPIPCGSGNVVTDIWPNPAGVPVVVKGFNALTAEDIANKLDKTGDASNVTSTLTKASGDTSTMTSGGKLSAIFTAISSFFASVASALGGKADKVTSATNGNFASLDSNGNLTDSGKKAADFDKKRYSWDTNGMYRVFETPNTNVSNKWVKLAEVDASSITGSNRAIQFTGYVYNYGQNKRSFTKFVKVPFSAVFDVTDDSQGVVVGNISGIDPLFGAPRVNDLIRIEKIDSKHWILELYTYSYQAYSLEIEASSLSYSTLQPIVWASSDLTDTAPGTGTIINSTLDDYDNCVNSITARDYASGGGIASALGEKADKANITGATKCKITYNGQGIVTSGADLGASDIPNLPASKITSGQFGTDRIADDAITANKVKDNETLPVNVSGTAKHLDCYGFWHTYGTGYYDPSKPYAIIGELNLNVSGNAGAGQLLQFELDSEICARVRLDFKWSNGLLQRANVLIIDSSVDYSTLKDWIKITHFTFTSGGNTFLCIRLYVKFTGDWQVWRVRQLDCQTGDCGFTNWADFPLRVGNRSQESAEYGTLATYKFSYPYANGQVGSSTIPVYVDPNGQVQPCTQGATLKSNTATLYIAGTFGEGNIPYYNVKDVKNGCINYVHVKDIPYNSCSITIEAPTLASGEEYDYVVVFDTFANSNLIGSIDAENCKTAGHMDNGVFVVDSMVLTSANPRYVPMIVVTGNVASSKWYDRT